jgi:hypothetical protein
VMRDDRRLAVRLALVLAVKMATMISIMKA